MDPSKLTIQIMKQLFTDLSHDDEFNFIKEKIENTHWKLFIHHDTNDFMYVIYANNSREALEKLFKRLDIKDKIHILFNRFLLNDTVIYKCIICSQICSSKINHYNTSHDEKDIIEFILNNNHLNRIFKEKEFIR